MALPRMKQDRRKGEIDMRKCMLALALCLAAASASAQSPYPFTDTRANRDILAYWYNIPKSEHGCFASTLQVYGMAGGNSLKVTAEVYDKSGRKVFELAFSSSKPSGDSKGEILWKGAKKNRAFYIECEVPQQKENPAKIVVTVESSDGKRVKEIACRYDKISGNITDFDGKGVKAYVSFGPDDFSGQIGVWSDDRGAYTIEVPERAYNAVMANNDNYNKTSLECWGWHVIVDRDERMDFRIGTAEVYNLNAWTNNYSKKTFLLSFRPMALALSQSMGQPETVCISGAARKVVNIAPDLESSDVKVTINDKPAKVLSVQRYYETGNDYTMPAYIVQVSAAGIDTTDKTTFMLEYDTTLKHNGKKVRCSSMGFCMVLFNRMGFSPYF
jgi:hypothetical protein